MNYVSKYTKYIHIIYFTSYIHGQIGGDSNIYETIHEKTKKT